MAVPRVDGERSPRVLVVEGEPTFANAISVALREHGFETLVLASGRAAERAVATFRPDIVVLDVVLADLDPLELARRLRDGGGIVPLICLTTSAAGNGGHPVAGGSDWFTKPLDVADLVARVLALFRLTLREAPRPNAMCFADLVLDEQTHEVTRAAVPIELSPTEFRLLRFFLLNPRRVLSKRQILDSVWPNDFDGDVRVVETYVSYLRRKLDSLGPPLLQTVRLVGYVLREPEPQA
jgi:two-component system OmpR family response regulator